jgi:hypothetical protein
LFSLLAGTVFTYDGITFYRVKISATEQGNSEGVALTTVPEMLQQDRANYDKFKQRDPRDQADGFFTTVGKRHRPASKSPDQVLQFKQ